MFRWTALFLCTAVVAVVWVLYGSDLLPGRVTVYSATCLRRGADGRCTTVGRTMEPSRFHVWPARQQVESVQESGATTPLRACTVTSTRDWRCQSASDDAIVVGVSGGQPWLRIHGSAPSDLVFLPRWRYLWERSGESRPPAGPALFQLRV